MKITKRPQCSAIIQPGEYLISRWDNKPCHETSLMHLIKCDQCGKHFCLTMHWRKHVCP